MLACAYELSDEAVAGVIERTLQTDVLVVKSEQEVFAATIVLKEARGSPANALIGALAPSVAVPQP